VERTNWHILSNDSRSRAEQSRFFLSIGHHAEVYGALDELLASFPTDGILLANETGKAGAVGHLLRQLSERGIWLPVVIAASIIDVDLVVAAMRAGALDYLPLPLDDTVTPHRLRRIWDASAPFTERRRAEIDAVRQLSALSEREREVLALVSSGLSNKEVGGVLTISPRTVEIHRANVVAKLCASGTVEAVRTWWTAGFDRSACAAYAPVHGRTTAPLSSHTQIGYSS
jgi:two-component system response regulator FixJ